MQVVFFVCSFLVVKFSFRSSCFLFLVRRAAFIGVWFASFLSHPRSIRTHFCIHDLKKQYQGSMGSDDAARSVLTSFKILSKLGLCTFGQRGGSITLVKPSDPLVIPPLTARIASLFRLPPDRVCAVMITRDGSDQFEMSASDDLFHCLSPKITAFWNAEDAMRRDDQADAGVPIADAAVSVGSLASAQIAH